MLPIHAAPKLWIKFYSWKCWASRSAIHEWDTVFYGWHGLIDIVHQSTEFQARCAVQEEVLRCCRVSRDRKMRQAIGLLSNAHMNVSRLS